MLCRFNYHCMCWKINSMSKSICSAQNLNIPAEKKTFNEVTILCCKSAIMITDCRKIDFGSAQSNKCSPFLNKQSLNKVTST